MTPVSHQPLIIPRPVPAELLAVLAERLGARLSTAWAVREHHGRDESPFDVPPPDAVLFFGATSDATDPSVVVL